MTIFHFFCSGWGLNLKPYIYYALFLTIELSSQGHLIYQGTERGIKQ